MSFTVPLTIQALSVLHSSESNSVQRQQASYYCEQLKSNTAQCLQIATELINQSPATAAAAAAGTNSDSIIHFGFHSLLHIINSQWNQLGVNEQNYLKQQIITIVQNIANNQQQYSKLIRQKLVDILCNLCFRCWPQNWPELLPILISLSSQSLYATEITVLFYRNVSESITAFNPHLPEQRRREVQSALLVGMESIFQYLHSTLKSAASNSNNTNNQPAIIQSIIISLLECFNALLDWLPSKYIFADSFLSDLCSLLVQPQYYILITELLSNITSRKHSTIDIQYHQQLLGIWEISIRSLESLLNNSNSNNNPSLNHQQYIFGMLHVLTNLIRLHTELLQQSPQQQQQQNSSISQLINRFLSILGQLLSHPNPKISLESLDSWVLIFRLYRKIIIPTDSTIRKNLINELFKITVLRLIKTATDEIDNNYSELFQLESIEEYQRYFGQFRGTLLQLIIYLVAIEPIICLNLTAQRYSQLIQLPSATDHLNSNGYVSTQTSRFLEIEAIGSVLETIMRGLESEKELFHSNLELITITKSILFNLIQYSPVDPLLQTRRLHTLALFTGLYEYHPETLSLALEQIINGLTFKSPQELNSNTNYNELSEDSRACRRRAIHSLIHIGRRLPSMLLPVFNQLGGRILELVSAGSIVDSEKILLFEFLVVISTSMPNPADQQEFIRNILNQPIAEWESNQLTNIIQDQQQFNQLIGLDSIEQAAVKEFESKSIKDPINSNNNNKSIVITVQQSIRNSINDSMAHKLRSNILNILTTFISVFKTVCASHSVSVFAENTPAAAAIDAESIITSNNQSQQPPHPSAGLLTGVLDNVFRLLGCIYSLRRPEILAQFPIQMRPAIIASSVEHLSIIKGSALSDSVWLILLNDIRLWLDRSIEASLSLLTIAARSGNEFYSNFPSKSPLIIQSIFNLIPIIHHRELRFLIDKFIAVLLQQCKSQYYSTVLSPILPGLLQSILNRLKLAWNQYSNNNNNNTGAAAAAAGNNNSTNNESAEIFDDTELRELTRSYIDLFVKLVLAFDLASEKTAKSINNTNGTDSNNTTINNNTNKPKIGPYVPPTPGAEHPLIHSPFFQYIIRESAIGSLVLESIIELINFPDSVSQQKTVRFALRFITLTAAGQSQYYSLLLSVFQSTLQQLSIQPYRAELITTMQTDLISLIKEIYQLLYTTVGSVQTQLKSILLSIPAVTVNDIELLDNALNIVQSQKKQKTVFKVFLAKYLMGKSTTTAAATANIQNLNNKLNLPKSNTNNNNSNNTEIDTTALNELFKE